MSRTLWLYDTSDMCMCMVQGGVQERNYAARTRRSRLCNGFLANAKIGTICGTRNLPRERKKKTPHRFSNSVEHEKGRKKERKRKKKTNAGLGRKASERGGQRIALASNAERPSELGV